MRKWIQKAIRKRGSFTAQARRRGLTPKQFMQRVLQKPERYDATTVRRARLMRTLMGFRKGKRR